MTRVAIVDTGSGNLRSVHKALEAAGAQAEITGDADRVHAADKVVVPGQGAFGACLEGLARNGGALAQAVRESIDRGKPYLGLCLGLQILFEGSDESPGCRGLGVLAGTVKRFAPQPGLKIPHMGWNDCQRGPAAVSTAMLRGVAPGTWFYFVHSFYAAPSDPTVVALEAEHGVRFCAAVARDNVFASQFHPEKSQSAGLALLRNFVAS